MSRLPRRAMRRRITVEPYLGDGAVGPLYGPQVTVRCFLDEQTRMVRGRDGRQVTSTGTAYCALETVCPAESRITLADGRRPIIINVLRRDGGGLPTPDHLEIQMQ